MHFVFTVEVEIERDEGVFASREELEAQVQEALEGADPGSISGDEGGQYSVTMFEVSHDDAAVEAARLARKRATEARRRAAKKEQTA